MSREYVHVLYIIINQARVYSCWRHPTPASHSGLPVQCVMFCVNTSPVFHVTTSCPQDILSKATHGHHHKHHKKSYSNHYKRNKPLHLHTGELRASTPLELKRVLFLKNLQIHLCPAGVLCSLCFFRDLQLKRAGFDCLLATSNNAIHGFFGKTNSFSSARLLVKKGT